MMKEIILVVIIAMFFMHLILLVGTDVYTIETGERKCRTICFDSIGQQYPCECRDIIKLNNKVWVIPIVIGMLSATSFMIDENG